MLAEHATYALWKDFGVPAPRHGYARLTVNGELYGLYGVADAVDEDFVARVFPEAGGALFEGEMGDFTTDLYGSFAVVDDGGKSDPHARLEAVVAELDAAPVGARGATLAGKFDLDGLLAAMAVELVSGNDDAYSTYTNNYFVYDDPGTGKLVWIEWGPDQAFGEPLDVLGDWPGRLYRDCRGDLDCDAQLRAAIHDVAATLDSAEWRGWIAEVADATAADCLADPRAESSCDWGRGEFFEWADARPAAVFATLETTP
jgi:spore coat protein CotH